ncbi:hypothetical protein Taro_032573 [Colocasia esculenta]|uniref:Uncharacterized protein n=1 Tax=Colocasia esculenta TaxID=4460 RepID=A0A843VVA1_COLES|nr:hypothetical protein [Colocasia esculenta]
MRPRTGRQTRNVLLALTCRAKQVSKAVKVLTVCRLRETTVIIKRQTNTGVQAKVEIANTSHVNWFATPETDSDKLTQVYLSVSQPRTKGLAAAPCKKVKQLWRPTKTPPPADHTVTGPCLTPPETLAWAR